MTTSAWYAPEEERYFMSDEQKDALIGRVARERSEAKRHLEMLRAEGRRLGTILFELGRQLQTEPAYVVFDNQPTNVEYTNQHSGRHPYKPTDINGEALIKLTNEIRGTMDTIKSLDHQR